jgi:L-alanine-DL-glutamate epimerase-like enolase superfamily enzyme
VTICDVEAFVLPYREPNDHGSTRSVCLVKVTTKDGVAGWGEGVTLFEEASRATAEIVRGLREFLVGVDATPEAAGEAIRARSWWYGAGGIASFALSAIDIALWDIQGRIQGRTLVDLLGGPVHDSLPILSSSHAMLADLSEMAATMAGWIATAQSAGVKVGFGKSGAANLGFDRERDIAFVRQLRAAIGPDARIMIDIGARIRWSVDEAIDRTLAFEADGVDWIEEPLGADDPEGYAALKAATSTRIAYGEREWTVRGVERIVASGTVDVVGIDPGRAEGVTGFAKIARFIHEHGVEANAHAFAGPISYAASLALSLSTPACAQLEVPPYLNELYDVVGLPGRPLNGRVHALSDPGLGFDIDEQSVRAAASI